MEMYHTADRCSGEFCCIHNPSDHHMNAWPLQLKMSGQMERTCPHGIGHPDPDSIAYFNRVEANRLQRSGPDEYPRGFYEQQADENLGWRGVHGCDGCCVRTEL